ncbi:MAG: aldehyde ferredoxin oxidoreductase family protein [Candidatus Methanodesulfokora sp.]
MFPYMGYAGKILRVDLTTKKIWIQPLRKDLARNYIGGTGMASRILWEEVKADIDPLGPENRLIVVTGPVTGTIWHTAGRAALVAKSPLTGIWGESHFGGFFGPELKFSGYDAIIIQGRSERPVYLCIYDGKPEIKKADHLWGKNTYETADMIREELDDREVKIAAIGQAGENLVKFANVMTGFHNFAGRTGMGAVMGSKKLKAIAVRGFGSVKVADMDKLLDLAYDARERILKCDQAMELRNYGTPMLVGAKQAIGELPTKNHYTGIFGEYEEIDGPTIRRRYWAGTKACFSCFLACKKNNVVRAGEFEGTFTAGPEYEGVYAFGSNLMISNMPAILRMNYLSNAYGMDVISLGVVMGFLAELFENKIIDEKETGGFKLEWGDYRTAVEAVEMVAFRRGIGDLMAEGVREMAKRIGRGSEKYAMHVKGLEISGQDGRTHRSAGLTHATAARGADHMRSLVTVDQLGYRDVAAKRFGEDKVERVCNGYSEDFKALAVKMHEDAYAIRDSLIVCWYSVGWPPVFWMDDFAKILVAVTGEEEFGDVRELFKIGERINNVKRAFNVRHGITRKDDVLPDRFTKEPMPDGPGRGQVVNLDRMLDEYYELRGWDRNGIPGKDKLLELDLADVEEEISRIR